jgi:hypothetical protein
MSTWIVWNDEPKIKFPPNFWKGDPLNQYQTGIEEEKCSQCEFTVKFISDKNQYKNWNDQTHKKIASILEHQCKIGACPSHPKPNWIA